MDKIKNKIYIAIIILFTLFIVVFIFLFKNVFTKLNGQINYISKNDFLKKNPNSYPVIESVYNSSGENITNNSVVLTVNAQSLYNIIGLEYSFDLNKWYKVNKEFNTRKISEKIIFNKTINSKVYVRVENNLNLKSYAYETTVIIDKEKPEIFLSGSNIVANDNNSIQKLQYFNDLSNYYEEEIYSSTINTKSSKDYNYVRAVDMAGNISETLKLTK